MILAIIINMVVVGLWHGANWTFAVFGLYHGLLFVPLILSGAFMKKAKLKTNRFGLPVLKDLGRMLLTFMLVTVGLIIVRAESIGQAWEYVRGMLQFGASYRSFTLPEMWLANLFIVIMLIVEWLQREKEHGLDISHFKPLVRWFIVVLLIEIVLLFMAVNPTQYIYFQF